MAGHGDGLLHDPMDVDEEERHIFPRFPELPTEVRQLIWEQAALHPRLIEVDNNNSSLTAHWTQGILPIWLDHPCVSVAKSAVVPPAVLHATHESRSLAMGSYIMINLHHGTTSGRFVYYNPDADIVHVGRRACMCTLFVLSRIFSSLARIAINLSHERYGEIPKCSAIDHWDPFASSTAWHVDSFEHTRMLRILHGFQDYTPTIGPLRPYQPGFDNLQEVFFVADDHVLDAIISSEVSDKLFPKIVPFVSDGSSSHIDEAVELVPCPPVDKSMKWMKSFVGDARHRSGAWGIPVDDRNKWHGNSGPTFHYVKPVFRPLSCTAHEQYRIKVPEDIRIRDILKAADLYMARNIDIYYVYNRGADCVVSMRGAREDVEDAKRRLIQLYKEAPSFAPEYIAKYRTTDDPERAEQKKDQASAACCRLHEQGIINTSNNFFAAVEGLFWLTYPEEEEEVYEEEDEEEFSMDDWD